MIGNAKAMTEGHDAYRLKLSSEVNEGDVQPLSPQLLIHQQIDNDEFSN